LRNGGLPPLAYQADLYEDLKVKRLPFIFILLASASVQAAPWGTEPVTLFDNLAPEEIQLEIDYYFSYALSSNEGWTGVSASNGAWVVPATFGLMVLPDFDAQTTPWMRIKQFDYSQISAITGGCNIDAPVEHSGARIAVTDLGNDWCRVEVDNEFTYMPPFPGGQYVYDRMIPNQWVSNDYESQGEFWSWYMDNVVLEFISNNIGVDFDPWNAANEIRPKDDYFITIQINTTSVADGDAYDFDAADVDPATLRVGPNMAEVATAPLTADYDNDGDTDYIFGFRMQDTGITCIDNSITISGVTTAGDPVAGHDLIVPIDCEEIIDIDVDPFNASNIVRPDDDYQLTVGILGMNTADGDAIGLDATQVDVGSLRFGPAAAPNTASPITGLLDGDTNTDLLVGFSMLDSGIACGDTELEMTGSLYSGQPIEGIDTITTTDCETSGCHP
jgi:hypothetical protein